MTSITINPAIALAVLLSLADEVIMNGPRAWVMDEVTIDTQGPFPIDRRPGDETDRYGRTSSGRMVRQPHATAVHREHVVHNTVYTYAANRPVYKLVDANASPARTYIMQSYSRTVDPTLTIGQLANLARKLTLPCGWSYVVETPTKDIVVKSGGAAHITQDSLQNTSADGVRQPTRAAAEPIARTSG